MQKSSGAPTMKDVAREAGVALELEVRTLGV